MIVFYMGISILQSQSLVNVCGDVVQVLYQVDLLHSAGSDRMGSVSPLIQDMKVMSTSSPKPKSDKPVKT